MGGRWCKICCRTEWGQFDLLEELNPSMLPEQDSLSATKKANVALWLIHDWFDAMKMYKKLIEASIWIAKVDWDSVHILSLN